MRFSHIAPITTLLAMGAMASPTPIIHSALEPRNPSDSSKSNITPDSSAQLEWDRFQPEYQCPKCRISFWNADMMAVHIKDTKHAAWNSDADLPNFKAHQFKYPHLYKNRPPQGY